MINSILLGIWLFLCCFLVFILLRLLHGILVKDIFYKYLIFDSLIYSIYFTAFYLFSFFDGMNGESLDKGKTIIFFILYIVLLPIIYNTIKGYFLKLHPKLKTVYYPIIELIIFIAGFICVGGLYDLILK